MAPTLTSNRQCTALTVCEAPYQRMSVAPTKTTDRACGNDLNVFVPSPAPVGKLANCQGNCNTDSDCVAGAVCYTHIDRIHSLVDNFVPGCFGIYKQGWVAGVCTTQAFMVNICKLGGITNIADPHRTLHHGICTAHATQHATPLEFGPPATLH